jgi:hypothetical protein
VATHFSDFVEESTTSSMSNKKKGNSRTNGSDLNRNNIIKPTFDTLMEEGHKALESYYTDLDELFYSCYKVMRHGVIPEVRPNSLISPDDVQSMINSVLEKQTKSNDELVCRLIEERDGKN